MSFTIDTADVERLARSLAGAEPVIRDEMAKAMTRSVLVVEGAAKRNAPVASGHLRRSITHEVNRAGAILSGRIGTNVPYARRLEEGSGYVTIRPKTKQFLMFEIGGKTIFTKLVLQPPRRGLFFMRKALLTNREAISREFAQVAGRVEKRLGLG